MSVNRFVANWNKQNPVGTPVVVLRDNGERLETFTRSEAWVLANGQAVVQVKGISGCYALDRVKWRPGRTKNG